MGDIGKKYNAALKDKIAREAPKEIRPYRVSDEYGVRPNQIMKWKKQLLEELPSICSDKRAKMEKWQEKLEKVGLSKVINRMKRIILKASFLSWQLGSILPWLRNIV